MTIELRLTEVDPPTEEPHRTIYHDIVNLPDPVIQSLTIRYFNHDDVGLYFKITGSGIGYTFTPVNLGLLATGTDTYANLDNFASRAKPTVAQLPNGQMGENITLTLTAYTDSGYTNLKWTFERVVQVIWINSTDAAFTLDFSNNFDDGTVQGWACAMETGYGSTTVAVTTGYVLSPPYSLRMVKVNAQSYMYERDRIYKSFTTPNKDSVYAIADIRVSCDAATGTSGARVIYVRNGSAILIQLGVQLNYAIDDIPRDRWIRVVVPLPKNTTLELQIAYEWFSYQASRYSYLWLDDFKIISK
jgi:hypothetical protein